jgi:hypothetical protein
MIKMIINKADNPEIETKKFSLNFLFVPKDIFFRRKYPAINPIIIMIKKVYIIFPFYNKFKITSIR